MRLTIAILCSLFIYVILPAQGNLEVVREKGRWGAKRGDDWIIQPKYDSLLQADADILTAYRKNKIFYFNAEGESIYKGRVRGSEEFARGMGIVQDRKGKYVILDKAGNMRSEPSLLEEPPVRYGRFLLLNHSTLDKHGISNQHRNLYLETGLVKKDLTSLSTYENFLIAEEKNLTTPGARVNTFFDLESGEEMEREVVQFKDTLGHLFLDKLYGHSTLYEKSTHKWVRNLDEIVLVDSVYFISKIFRNQSLYLWKDHQLLIRTDCERFEFRPEVIYAIQHESPDSGMSVRIFDYSGHPLHANLVILHQFEDGRILFQRDSLQYIGKENGDTLSGFHPRISPVAVNGFRIVSDASHYGYINDRTYQKLPVAFPIWYKARSTGPSNPGRDITKIITAIFVLPVVAAAGAVLAIPTGGKSMQMVNSLLGSFGGGTTAFEQQYDVAIPGPEQVFVEGYAIVCTSQPTPGTTHNVITPYSKMSYNYVDTTGAILNSKKYGACHPFQGGKAWVNEDSYWVQINKKGVRAGREKYEYLTRDDHGFFKCWNTYKTTYLWFFSSSYSEVVLYDHHNNRLHKGVFSTIELEGNVYYGTREGKRIKIAEAPATIGD